MFDSIRGVIVFQVLAAKPEEFINQIKYKRIPCKNIQIQNGFIIGKTLRKHYNRLMWLSKEEHAELSVVKKKGVIFTTLRYKKRYGLFAGSILALGFVFYMSNIVLKIEIQGNSVISGEQVLSSLKDNGVNYGKFIPPMDFRSVERSMMTSMKSMAWVGIHRIGGRLVVEIDEMDESPEIIPKHVPCNVVSVKDAQIVGAKVYRGTLVPKIGDGVQKGDLLISGIATEATGESFVSHAYGEITGRYTEKAVFTQSFNEQQNLLSGEEIKRKELQFFGLKIPLYIGKEIRGEFEYEESTNFFSLFNMNLPIGITSETYRPFEQREITYTPPEAEAAIRQKVAVYEANFIESTEILSKEEQLNINESGIKLVILYHLEGEIGMPQEILIKKQN